MTTAQRTLATLLACLACSAPGWAAETRTERAEFLYDKADQTIIGKQLNATDEITYDASIAAHGPETWIAALTFEPGSGDIVWTARLDDGAPTDRQTITSDVAPYANPTITFSNDQRWITYEAERDKQWDLLATVTNAAGETKEFTIADAPGPDIHHAVTPDGSGGLWIVWQSGADGQFDIVARHIGATGPDDATHRISESPAGDWHPRIAVAPNGTVHIVWDGYDGQSYNVYARTLRDGKPGPTIPVAASPAFEGRADVACDSRGRVWILWEEGGENWGAPYRAKRQYRKHVATDTVGPVHRFRLLRLAVLENGVLKTVEPALPMPSVDAALARHDNTPDRQLTGVFYERGRLLVDPDDKLWIVYRHNYLPWLAREWTSHVEAGFGLYARCLSADGWSSLITFDQKQRDGLQRLDLAWTADGLAAVWTVGRTDRREDDQPRGVFHATVPDPGGRAPTPAGAPREVAADTQPAAPRPDPKTVTVAGTDYGLYFGDLHRHTDLSLCFVPSDGTMDDAYRYAIDAAQLDFLGITDHTRDIARGDALSLLWWRCRKNVTRHELPGTFFPLYSYERSRSETDHNVFSLRPDMLRPHTYPHREFMKELDADTFMIPHQPFADGVWDFHDPARRPLLEIYQGFRDWAQEKDAVVGLLRGRVIGFIASSDHLSTNASFAAVWSPGRDRESIFRSMQARRTYAATAKIVMDVRAGNHWMGECVDADKPPVISIRIVGTAPIDEAVVLQDGIRQRRMRFGKTDTQAKYTPPKGLHGVHFYYVYVHQADGNQAWSSPIWIRFSK
jgi:hypothetical protein